MGTGPAFPDGLSKNGRHWLEIKRPKDTLSDWQKKQHDTFKTQTGGSVHMADCKLPGGQLQRRRRLSRRVRLRGVS